MVLPGTICQICNRCRLETLRAAAQLRLGRYFKEVRKERDEVAQPTDLVLHLRCVPAVIVQDSTPVDSDFEMA